MAGRGRTTLRRDRRDPACLLLPGMRADSAGRRDGAAGGPGRARVRRSDGTRCSRSHRHGRLPGRSAAAELSADMGVPQPRRRPGPHLHDIGHGDLGAARDAPPPTRRGGGFGAHRRLDDHVRRQRRRAVPAAHDSARPAGSIRWGWRFLGRVGRTTRRLGGSDPAPDPPRCPSRWRGDHAHRRGHRPGRGHRDGDGHAPGPISRDDRHRQPY